MIRMAATFVGLAFLASPNWVLAQGASPLSLDESIQLLRSALNSRTAQLGFDIPRGDIAWKVGLYKLNRDKIVLSFHPSQGVDFQLQVNICEKKKIFSDATILGPNETADTFYRDNLQYLIFVDDVDYVQCSGHKGMTWDFRKITDGRNLYTSEERVLEHMSYWMGSLAHEQHVDRSLDFLRAVVTKQREALLEAERGSDYQRVTYRIEFFDSMFPYDVFDHIELQPRDRQAVRAWLETTLAERKKLTVFEPQLAENASRDRLLLAIFSQPGTR